VVDSLPLAQTITKDKPNRQFQDESCETNMKMDNSLDLALKYMERALEHLEDRLMVRLENENQLDELEAEVQRMNADRSRLAQDLDHSEAKAERLEEANREVSNRLIVAMETIRTVIER